MRTLVNFIDVSLSYRQISTVYSNAFLLFEAKPDLSKNLVADLDLSHPEACTYKKQHSDLVPPPKMVKAKK